MQMKKILISLLLPFLFGACAGQKLPKLNDTTGMILVKGGAFQMGNNKGDSDEKPVHKVVLTDFYIGKYEVLQKEYNELMNENPSCFECEDCPVEQVSWYDAVAFCNRKSEKEGFKPYYEMVGKNVTINEGANGYRLPTEAEWEYAARGGAMMKRTNDSTKQTQENRVLGKEAWYNINSDYKTHKTGLKDPNDLKLNDMVGNVWEWCEDGYSSSYYRESPVNNPVNREYKKKRVLRGGAWYTTANKCRITYRYWFVADDNFNALGFRVVRSAPKK